MKSMSEIILSDSDIKNLKGRHIGSGSESDVYRAGEGILYKIYRFDTLAKDPSFLDGNELKSKYSDENIRIAMRRQPYVRLTSLPLCPLYDKRDMFIGCALPEHKLALSIQCVTMLPRACQIVILKRLLLAVKELCDNYIYHCDLVTKEIDGKEHANVLLSPAGKPKITDLDGASTLYTTNKNRNYENLSYVSLTALISEILFDIDTKDDLTELDIEWQTKRLASMGLTYELSEQLVRCECDYDSLDEILCRTMKL